MQLISSGLNELRQTHISRSKIYINDMSSTIVETITRIENLPTTQIQFQIGTQLESLIGHSIIIISN